MGPKDQPPRPTCGICGELDACHCRRYDRAVAEYDATKDGWREGPVVKEPPLGENLSKDWAKLAGQFPEGTVLQTLGRDCRYGQEVDKRAGDRTTTAHPCNGAYDYYGPPVVCLCPCHERLRSGEELPRRCNQGWGSGHRDPKYACPSLATAPGLPYDYWRADDPYYLNNRLCPKHYDARRIKLALEVEVGDWDRRKDRYGDGPYLDHGHCDPFSRLYEQDVLADRSRVDAGWSPGDVDRWILMPFLLDLEAAGYKTGWGTYWVKGKEPSWKGDLLARYSALPAAPPRPMAPKPPAAEQLDLFGDVA